MPKMEMPLQVSMLEVQHFIKINLEKVGKKLGNMEKNLLLGMQFSDIPIMLFMTVSNN